MGPSIREPLHGVPRVPSPLLESGLGGAADLAARLLLGAVLATEVGGQRAAGVIVETEAYMGPDDPACHAATRTGRTKRNDPMFGPSGTLYVYLSHGLHHCANVVTGGEGFPAAVLIRALEPVEGQEIMARRRGRADELCSGPGRLGQALGIGLEHNRVFLDDGPVRLERGAPIPDSEVGVSPRIGITKASDWPLRFFVRGHPAVKAPRW